MLGLTWLGEAAAVILFDDLRLVRTHSYQEAPVSQKKGPYPVLVFSHGYGAIAVQNTALMEELASHGYAVFSIGHTYESVVEIFPDGRQIRFSPRKKIDMAISNLEKGAEEIKSGDQAASIALIKKFNTPEAWGGSLDIWTADTQFVIDWLEKMNTDDPAGPFYGRLDMEKVGVLGMSFGGATASQVLFEDHRVKATINMDGGAPVGDLIDLPLNKPYMYMSSEPATSLGKLNQTVFDYMMEKASTDVYCITVMESKHENFMDLSVYSPLLKYTGLLGNMDGQKMLRIMNAYTLAFFERHLKGIDSPLLDGPSSDFPEVTLKARNNMSNFHK
jgi:dienelactone hydrolase